MAKPHTVWTVLPHGKLKHVNDDIRLVAGQLNMPPMGDVDRHMTVVRLRDGGLVVFSAICLNEPEMRELEHFGRPAYLIVPNDLHRMDAKVWRDRYPQMRVITPAAAREKVSEVVHVDATTVDFGDDRVRFLTVPGTGEREAALLIDSTDGTTLVLNDLLFDLANRPGLKGWLFEKLGMTGEEPHIPPIVKMRQVKDEAALKAQFEDWSRVASLRRIIIAHGEMIDRAPQQVLARIASGLSAS